MQLDDYKASVGARMATSLEGSGHQKGDPVRGCEAIIKAVETASPPLRLLLGEMAYKLAMEKANSMKANFSAWKALTLSANFPEHEEV